MTSGRRGRASPPCGARGAPPRDTLAPTVHATAGWPRCSRRPARARRTPGRVSRRPSPRCSPRSPRPLARQLRAPTSLWSPVPALLVRSPPSAELAEPPTVKVLGLTASSLQPLELAAPGSAVPGTRQLALTGNPGGHDVRARHARLRGRHELSARGPVIAHSVPSCAGSRPGPGPRREAGDARVRDNSLSLGARVSTVRAHNLH